MPDLSRVTELLPDIADYAVYGAIAIVTLIGFFKCLFPLWNVTRILHKAIRLLQEDAGNTGKPVWQETQFMGKRLKCFWLRFLQNAEQLDRRGLPTNVEDYINDDTAIHGPGNATLAELIPNLLTSLGILGTFMGLSRGLSTLDFANAEKLIEGIPDLLSGMKFAFGTSVAGISCSLVFNMLNRTSQGSGYRAVDEFVSSFTQLAMSRPLDNDVQLICQNQDRNHMLSDVTDTLVDRFADNVGKAVTRALVPVTDSMDRFLAGTTHNQIEGVTHIVNRFVDQMNASLSGQLLELARTMNEINENQRLSVQRAEATLQSAGGIIDNAARLQSLTDSILSHFDAYVAELNRTSARDERFEEDARTLLTHMQQESQAHTNTLGLLRKYQDELSASILNFREQSDNALYAMRKAGQSGTEVMGQATQGMKEAGIALSRSCESFADNVAESLSGTLAAFSGQMTELLVTLNAKVDAIAQQKNGADSASALGEIQRMMTAIKESIAGISETLNGLSGEA